MECTSKTAAVPIMESDLVMDLEPLKNAFESLPDRQDEKEVFFCQLSRLHITSAVAVNKYAPEMAANHAKLFQTLFANFWADMEYDLRPVFVSWDLDMEESSYRLNLIRMALICAVLRYAPEMIRTQSELSGVIMRKFYSMR